MECFQRSEPCVACARASASYLFSIQVHSTDFCVFSSATMQSLNVPCACKRYICSIQYGVCRGYANVRIVARERVVARQEGEDYGSGGLSRYPLAFTPYTYQ